MEKSEHLKRVSELQKRYNASLGIAETDKLLIDGQLREAIMQAGMSGCSIIEIRNARTV